MAITKGAKKAHRASLHKRAFNTRRKKQMNEVAKKIRTFTATGTQAEAQALMPLAYKAIDKAAKRGVIKGNTANRKKAQIASFVAHLVK